MKKLRSKVTVFILFSLLTLSNSYGARVLFDEGHRQAFTIEKKGRLDLSTFSQIIIDAGNQVHATKHPFTKGIFSEVDALIISGPFKSFLPLEITEIKRFVQSGGKLVVLIHISPTVGDLLAAFDIKVSNYIVNEHEQLLDNKSSSFVVSRLSEHALFTDISHFNLYGGWALKAVNHAMVPIASTSSNAWLDINKNKQRDSQDHQLTADLIIHGAFGHGEILIFADDAIFQNRFIINNNKKMAKNLAKWLRQDSFYNIVKPRPIQSTE